MAETLRELVVALSLDSSNFSRNMRTINQQIKEAESTFRLAGAGVQNYEKTIAGTEAKLSMLGQKLTQQQRAVEQYSRALVAANDKLKENYNRHQDYTQRLEQAKARQEDLRFEVEAATVAYEGYRDSLGETDSATIAAKQNLERYQEEYADATAEVTKLEGQVKALQKTMQNSADAVSKATTDLNNAKAAVKDTEAEIRRLTEQLYRMQSAWTQAGESLTAISKKCEMISKAMTKAGKSLTTHVTAPITALGTAAIKASVDYEYAFANVRKTVDATEEEYDRLSDSVKQMSTEVAASAEDIAEVMSIAGQLGIENEHLAEFTRTMIDLGNSTNMVAADAASEAARFANIMGMSQNEFQNLGSTLVDLGNNYATTESEIMEMSLRLAGAGKQVGLSEAQIMGFAAALSSVGIQAQMGGSAFSKALIKMEVAAATGGETLEDFAKVSGMSASIPFKHTLGFKRGPKGEILVDEEQARTVRDIYDWFLEGLTPHAIAARLMEKGFLSPHGKEVWHPGTVRSILSNEKYKGDALMQKFYTEDFLTKRQIPNKGVLPQYYVEGNHDAIIPPETFELVQLELERRKSKGGRYSGVDIFASRIVCGECGAYYGSKIWHSNQAKYRRVIYRCNQKYGGDKLCSTPHVTEEQLKQGFVAALNKLISKRDDIIAGLTEGAETLYDTSALETEKKRLWDEMCVLAEMVQAAINENAHVALDQKEYQNRYDELASRYDSVKAEHDKVAGQIATLVSTKTAAQQFISTLHGLQQRVTAFTPETWGKLLDHATVYADGTIRFTFRNGIEI